MLCLYCESFDQLLIVVSLSQVAKNFKINLILSFEKEALTLQVW